MKKSYKVKINQGSEKSTTVDIPAAANQPIKIKSLPAAKYLLVDETTGMAPDNIRVKRIGKDLSVSFSGSNASDLLITDYYENTVAGFNAVIGEAEAGVYHAYIPESGAASSTVAGLSDGGKSVGMALGGEPVVASGAAVGALVAAAGFNPILAAPLALLGAGGGGGGGSVGDTTPPKVTAAKLAPDDDTGVSNSDNITSDNTPRLLITADADAVSATVTIAGKTYTSTTKNEQGQFVVQIPDDGALANGDVTYSVVVKDAAGNVSESIAAPSFVVDRSSDHNYTPAEQADVNKGVSVQIVSIDADTGVTATDFTTSDNTLTFKGTVANTFVKNGDFVELHLLDSTGEVVASQYVEPVNAGGQWGWSWDDSAQKLTDGTYQLTAQVVDKAGNAVGAGLVQKEITIDTNANPDTNSQFAIAVTSLDQDSGASDSDFLTKDRALSFKGNIGNSNTGFTGKVLVQVLGTDGVVKSQSYVDPATNGSWSFDNTSRSLGIPDTNTQYVLKASVVDLAGNTLKSTDQSFTVDLKLPTFSVDGASFTGSKVIFNKMQLTPGNAEVVAEAGTFTHTPLGSNSAISAFNAGDFSITYTDLAGNSSLPFTNQLRWEFEVGAEITKTTTTSSPSPSTFNHGELAGSIGKYILAADTVSLDLSALHSTSPQVGDVVAINHISLSGGGAVADAAHVLTLTTSDVLALGVKNSFISNGHVQMRIDGEAADKVVLDDLLGQSTYAWTQPTVEPLTGYHLYSNTDLGLDLLIQQAVEVRLV
jgi:hypothetical protein